MTLFTQHADKKGHSTHISFQYLTEQTAYLALNLAWSSVVWHQKKQENQFMLALAIKIIDDAEVQPAVTQQQENDGQLVLKAKENSHADILQAEECRQCHPEEGESQLWCSEIVESVNLWHKALKRLKGLDQIKHLQQEDHQINSPF
ncbi:hypothetical protein ROHU_029074 [Labeo rohita]|uniref:Uncharacterized protein n=1 Tax=Labeo rohita TaxID=84645 RepID=A0A498M6N0_LABRO|nr:hypothetical protein ROHU_029074 [Labeo rohita]